MPRNPSLKPMVETWENGSVPDWRPQIACYPYFSELVSDYGSAIKLGTYPVAKGLELLNAKLQQYMDSSKCWAGVNLTQGG